MSTLLEQPWLLNAVSNALNSKSSDPLFYDRLENDLLSRLFLYILEKDTKEDLKLKEIWDFVCFCREHAQHSKSQILQDLWVLFKFSEKKAGFFVEFGACDGLHLSNTYLLEKQYGWTGILAEALPFWNKNLRDNRNVFIDSRVVHRTTGDKVKFNHVIENPDLSRLTMNVPNDIHERNGNRKRHEAITVETVTINDLLKTYDAPQYIDYLSIDTEGTEAEIIQSIDFGYYKFGLITVEHAGESSKRDIIFERLKREGYRRWNTIFSRWDDWYVGELQK